MTGETYRFTTASEKETTELGQRLGEQLFPGAVISLEGDLGTGKTAITKGIAKGLGVFDMITSPTFTLVNTYSGRITLHHFDVYRVDDPDELYAIGWEEYFTDDAVTIVEWGDRIPEMLPANTLHIVIKRDETSPDNRIITIERQAS
ncbi:MAG: tRNA (adenosine(37)-N6)-threonylcarbamoyltransferase complex ATPase subunit type 1 TsaE [Clostridia bacterium]|nr:tRNA (adenosine(37)-N6)-threonylcarbamoyltransferase complex ATPase subunit type 1 TsaE [Clostridia bacterium]